MNLHYCRSASARRLFGAFPDSIVRLKGCLLRENVILHLLPSPGSCVYGIIDSSILSLCCFCLYLCCKSHAFLHAPCSIPAQYDALHKSHAEWKLQARRVVARVGFPLFFFKLVLLVCAAASVADWAVDHSLHYSHYRLFAAVPLVTSLLRHSPSWICFLRTTSFVAVFSLLPLLVVAAAINLYLFEYNIFICWFFDNDFLTSLTFIRRHTAPLN